MARRSTWLAAGFAVALAPRASLAADLELGLEAAMGYDDNVFSRDVDEQSDVFLRLGPRLRIDDEEGKLRWQLRYHPRYDKYVDLDEIDGWDHNASASISWTPSARTLLTVSDRFLDYDNFTPIFSDVLLPDGTIDSGIEFGRESFRQNALSASLEHQLRPRHSVNVQVNRFDNRFVREIVSETEVTVLGGGYFYQLRREDRIGLELGGTLQEISDERDNQSETGFYNVSLAWAHTFDPTFRFNVSAGPTWVDADEGEIPAQIPSFQFPSIRGATGGFAPIQASTCPRLDDGSSFVGNGCQPFPASVSFPLGLTSQVVDLGQLGEDPDRGQDLTYFANVSVVKEWRDFALVLRYSRFASTTADVAGSIRDNLSASLIWRPGRRWTLTLNSYYEMREEFNETTRFATVVRSTTVNGVAGVAEAVGFQVIAEEQKTEVDGYVVSLHVTYALSRRTQLFGNLFWYAERVRSETDERSSDRFRALIGVTYTLPSFELPI